MTASTEQIILAGLVREHEYADAVLPFLKPEYFLDTAERTVFETILAYHEKYNVMPNQTALTYEATHDTKLPDQTVEQIRHTIGSMFGIKLEQNLKWMLDTTETFCQHKAMYNVIMTAVEVYEGEEKRIPETAIPDMMRDAVNISFDMTVGHDWLDDAEKRYDFYTNPESTIPFDIAVLNEVTGGHGVPKKTLNVILAGVNAGKTGLMCYLASAYAKQGYNVLYITLEMREEMISKRIDANVLNIPLDDMSRVSRDVFMGKVEAIKQKGYGKIIVKEYPTGTAHSGHFNYLIKDIKKKRGIDIDVVFVDYIGICASSRVGMAGTNSYTYLKSVAEELRGLAMEHDCVLWSAIQLNRGGFSSTDVDMTDVADCLDPSTLVKHSEKGDIPISELNVGDSIMTHSGKTTTVKMVHCKKTKPAFRIKTKSGKEIIASDTHVFPTAMGRKRVKDLVVGDKLCSLENHS